MSGVARPGTRSFACSSHWVRRTSWRVAGTGSFPRRDTSDTFRSWIAENTNPDARSGSLSDALVGADVFIGVSAPNILTGNDIAAMAANSGRLRSANPIPEVDPLVAGEHAAVVATGRSDFPNQINNVLAFPGVFRGLLDAHAVDITDDMLIAAARAISDSVSPSELNSTYIVPRRVLTQRLHRRSPQRFVRLPVRVVSPMSDKLDLLFRAPRVITAAGEVARCIGVRDGRIVVIEPIDAELDADEVVELGDDEVLIPGLVDTHVHVNEPGRTEWEGFASATRAAAAGGVTTIVDMPLNSIPPTVDVEALAVKRRVAADQALRRRRILGWCGAGQCSGPAWAPRRGSVRLQVLPAALRRGRVSTARSGWTRTGL